MFRVVLSSSVKDILHILDKFQRCVSSIIPTPVRLTCRWTVMSAELGRLPYFPFLGVWASEPNQIADCFFQLNKAQRHQHKAGPSPPASVMHAAPWPPVTWQHFCLTLVIRSVTLPVESLWISHLLSGRSSASYSGHSCSKKFPEMIIRELELLDSSNLELERWPLDVVLRGIFPVSILWFLGWSQSSVSITTNKRKKHHSHLKGIDHRGRPDGETLELSGWLRLCRNSEQQAHGANRCGWL